MATILWMFPRFLFYVVGAEMLVRWLHDQKIHHFLSGMVNILLMSVAFAASHVLSAITEAKHQSKDEEEVELYRFAERELIVFLVALLTALIYTVQA